MLLKMPFVSLSDSSPSHILLLAAHYATSSSINPLQSLASLRPDALPPVTLLRLILTFLPEITDPAEYVGLVQAAVDRDISPAVVNGHAVHLDLTYAQHLSDKEAAKETKKLNLLNLNLPDVNAVEPVVHFIIHRARRIDDESGLLRLIPPLVTPFLLGYPYLRLWFVSFVLPLLRLEVEFYPRNTNSFTLREIEAFDHNDGIQVFLQPAFKANQHLARDLRCLIAPWIYGEQLRRQKQNQAPSETINSWDETYRTLVKTAKHGFIQIAKALEEWEGPEDVEFCGYDRLLWSQDEKKKLIEALIRLILACIYATQNTDHESISSSYRLLSKVSNYLGSQPLPALPLQLEDLTSLSKLKPMADGSIPQSIVDSDHFLDQTSSSSILISSSDQSLLLARHVLLSAWLLIDYGYPISPSDVVKMRFFSNAEEQTVVLQRILHHISTASRKPRSDWPQLHTNLFWLWGWGAQGQGIFGQIELSLFEKQILEALVYTGCYQNVVDIYINSSSSILSPEQIEQVVISTALQNYDNASNGNRTRGSMRSASDMLVLHTHTRLTFELTKPPSTAELGKYFPESNAFSRLSSLITATHLMSFYSLTLHAGVPFKPVNIRVSPDPLSLIEKILAQNPQSYSKLEDLISIGRHITIALAFLPHECPSQIQLEKALAKTQRRVIAMVVEAALAEDDFDSAYSYVVTRLHKTASSTSPSSASFLTGSVHDDVDDVAYKAALAAGRYKPSASSPNFYSNSLKRVNQRMDLLSSSLLLAPPHALTEILEAWRKCEEELSVLLSSTPEDLSEDMYAQVNLHDSTDDSGMHLPGAFVSPILSQFVQPKSSMVGFEEETGADIDDSGYGEDNENKEETPRGMFNVARDAARAFSRTVGVQQQRIKTPNFLLRGGGTAGCGEDSGSESGNNNNQQQGKSDTGEERLRRRDMVANAVTGSLVSGIGWVLGATPNQSENRNI